MSRFFYGRLTVLPALFRLGKRAFYFVGKFSLYISLYKEELLIQFYTYLFLFCVALTAHSAGFP